MEVIVIVGYGEGRGESSELCGNGGMRALITIEGFGDRVWGRIYYV